MKKDKALDYLIAIVVLFVFVIPFVKLFIRSFGGDGLIINYSKIFSDKRIIKGIINTFIIGITSSFLTLMVGSYLAFIIAYTNIRFKSILKILVYLPFIVPSYIMTLAWTNITSSVGIVTKILTSLGLKPINPYSMGGIIFLMIVCYTPFVYLSVYRSLIKVPQSHEYASKLLNYGSFETFKNINLKQFHK